MSKTAYRRFIALGLVACGALALNNAGCQSSGGPAATAPAVADSGKGGAQLWAENCNRCHNARSPSSYSAAEWDVAMRHMRMRVPLTAEEYRKIAVFLKSGAGSETD
jgi:cytochrome c5